MTPVTLSICIATLNRATFLRQALESIIAQATEEVEVVIVDGASTDDTEQVVRQYQLRYPRLTYLRLAAKGGVDQDYSRTIELAQGKYCWFMSDDDILKPGAIRTLLAATQQDYSLIIVNSEMRTFDMREVMDLRRLPISADRIYQPAEYRQLFVDTGFYLSFIGAVVIQRELWNARDKQRYFGTEFVHVGVIFQSPLPGAALVLAEPLLALRYGNAQWSPRYFEIWMMKWPRLVWSFPNFSEAEKQQVYPREPWRNLKTLLIFRAQGVFSWTEYSLWIRPQREAGVVRLTAGAIACVPGRLASLLMLAYFSIARPSDAMRLAELRDSRFYYKRCLRCMWPGRR